MRFIRRDDCVSDFRSDLSACGFRVATMAFSGFAGHPCYHARTVVDGEYLDVAFDTVTERVTVIGTPDVLTLADAVERFRPPADAPALPWLDRVKRAGFRDVRWDTSPLGERYNLRHYSATRADGSRWLILAESESLLCHSDRPWSSWKLGRDGTLVVVGSFATPFVNAARWNGTAWAAMRAKYVDAG